MLTLGILCLLLTKRAECLQAQLAKEPGLSSHFHSCSGGYFVNDAKIKEAEVCFSTAGVLERDSMVSLEQRVL